MTQEVVARKVAALPEALLDEGVLGRAVNALAAMRRFDDADYILDLLVSTIRLVVPDAGVWAAASLPDGRIGSSASVQPEGVDALAMLEGWSARLGEGRPPFETDIAETPLGGSLGLSRVTVFRMSSAERLGAVVVGVPLQNLDAPRLSLISLLVEHVSMALTVSTAHTAAEHTEALFETLAQLSASYTDATLVLETIVRRTAALLGMDAAWVMLADEEKRRLTLTTVVGISSPAFADMSISVDDLLPGAAIRKRRVVCLRDAQGDEQSRYSRPEGLRTILCAPMLVEDELMGVLVAAHREIRDASQEDRRIMAALASAAAVSIGNARLYADHKQRSAALQKAMQLQQSLTTLVLEGSGLEEIVRVITEALDCVVVILDRDLALLHGSDAADLDLSKIRSALAVRDQPALGSGIFRLAIDPNGREVVVAPLALAGEPTAFVVVAAGEGRLHGVDLGMTESAVTAIALELMRDRATAEAEARLTGGLFQALLASDGSDDATITRRASYLGYELSGANVVVATALPEGKTNTASGGQLSLQTCIQRAVRRHIKVPTAVFEHNDAVFVLLSDVELVPAALVREHCSLITRELETIERFSDARIAFAGSHLGVAGIRRAVAEAGHALTVLGALGKTGTPVAFGDLGVWSLLGGSGDRERLLAFAHGVLGGLIAHDAERHSQLVDTLRALVECNFHLRPAAERLFVHPNTLRYRIPRVVELTGLDLTAPDDRLRADIALRILDVVRAPA